jgi:hypothetical protein
MKLPASRNVVRYVGGKHIGDSTGALNGSAFDRTPKDRDGLSFTQRLILFKSAKKDEAEIRRIVGSRLHMGKMAVFAELNVGAALGALKAFEADFYFREDALAAEGNMLANPAHALLIGLPFVGETVGSLRSEHAGDILRQTVRDTFPAFLPT